MSINGVTQLSIVFKGAELVPWLVPTLSPCGAVPWYKCYLRHLCIRSSPRFFTNTASASQSVPAIFSRVWSTTRSNPTSTPMMDAKGAWRHQKRGAGAPMSSDSGLLTRYQDLTTSFQIHKIPTCDSRSRNINIDRQCGYGHKKHWYCLVAFPSGIQLSKAKSHQHDPRDTAHERKTAGRRNWSLLPSLLCLWVLDDKRSSSLIRSPLSNYLSMHIKNKWIRSALFASSGLMFAIGITKMGDQTSALIVITGGLVSLAALLSRIPDQE